MTYWGHAHYWAAGSSLTRTPNVWRRIFSRLRPLSLKIDNLHTMPFHHNLALTSPLTLKSSNQSRHRVPGSSLPSGLDNNKTRHEKNKSECVYMEGKVSLSLSDSLCFLLSPRLLLQSDTDMLLARVASPTPPRHFRSGGSVYGSREVACFTFSSWDFNERI